MFINSKKYYDLMSTKISEKIEVGPFPPANNQHMWKDKLCLASEVCYAWSKLQVICFRKVNPVHPKDFDYCHIVDNFALIDESDIMKVDFLLNIKKPILPCFMPS